MADHYGFSVDDEDTDTDGGNAYFDDFHEDDSILHEYIQLSTYQKALCQDRFRAKTFCMKNNGCFAVSNLPSIGSAVVHASATSGFQFDTFNLPVKDCISEGDYFGSTTKAELGECFAFGGSGVFGQNVETATFTITDQCSDDAVMIPTQSYIAPTATPLHDEAVTTISFPAFMLICLVIGLIVVVQSRIIHRKSHVHRQIMEKAGAAETNNVDDEKGTEEEVYAQFLDMPRAPLEVIISKFPNSYQAISADT